MTALTKTTALLHTLRQLLPDAVWSVTHERPYCSLNLTGTQLRLSGTIARKDHHKAAAEYARILPEYEFNLGEQLVADIAVTEHVTDEAESRLIIHALLLGD